jgi:hypothetical protein
MSVAKLRKYALERIEQCRKDELKFCASQPKGKRASTMPVPQAAIEAWTERMTLQRVLSILGDDA